MQQVNTPRRDPAPSRIAYRMNRLWLTPSFRIALRYGLPFGIVALVVGGYLASPDRRAAIVAQYDSVKHSIEQRPEFM
ncbi:cell division protein FtsQ, partial [Thioclava sp. BHET1]